jgi:hypothetical protein
VSLGLSVLCKTKEPVKVSMYGNQIIDMQINTQRR